MELIDKSLLTKERCEEVLAEEVKDFIPIAEDMIQYCVENGGIGLAAPQIGINKRFFVWMNTDQTFQIIFNPSWFSDSKKTHVVETCLSFPNQNYYLERTKRIRMVSYGWDGTKLIKTSKDYEGNKAFIIQHEIDHLNGKSIADIGTLIEN